MVARLIQWNMIWLIQCLTLVALCWDLSGHGVILRNLCRATRVSSASKLPFPLIDIIHAIIIFRLAYTIRLIPQGTVDNNLGPDHFPGPKALDPNNCRQPTLWLHDLCLEVLTVHGIELRLFGAKAFPLLILLMSRIWQSSSRYNF